MVDSASAVSEPGGAVAVPLTLRCEPGERVAAVQADIDFPGDALVFESVTAGNAATEAKKSISHSMLGPGKVRMLAAGLNQDCIPTGAVATLRFQARPGAPATCPVKLTDVLCADPAGARVAIRAVSGEIATGAPEPARSDAGDTGFWGCFASVATGSPPGGDALLLAAQGMALWGCGRAMGSRTQPARTRASRSLI